ncbi:2-(3-amino-3-carboxypropyl)histidine synthase subunit 2 [Aricia agestis]|uniref:2-(3-amino-3-carboxypropyl)histidine synthase subunit 2 n=1 Tax=Aricia agestis TaxID=91739 RepID=UPI001C207725|nr:2-(3-amino-3-carboxypropyl)histidine synthase subunit 2 [Aricia agestis]
MANLTTDGKICIERELEVTESKDFDDIISYFDVKETCKWISDNNFNKVCLQFPDELLCASPKVYKEIQNRTQADVYILGDTSYASCCVDAVAAMHVSGDAIVHYGQSCFTKTNIPVYIVLPKKQLDIKSLETLLQNFKEHAKICLFYDSEYDHCKNEISRILFQNYPDSYLAAIELCKPPLKFCGRVVKDKDNQIHPVDVLQECTCVYVGSRGQTLFNFTISIKAASWYLLDPDSKVTEVLNETTWFKRRRYLIEKCKDANTVGILICKLAGDQTKDIISRLKQLCKINGKKSYIVSVGKPNVAKLANFPEIDIYVMVACPENELYNNRDFYKPIVYPYELELALNSNRDGYSTHHVTDYDELLPGNRHFCEVNHILESTDVSLITGKIRETKVQSCDNSEMALMENQNWALENIGQNLQDRSWIGLEQKLGETEVKIAEEGRKGIPLQYYNEPN